MIDNERIAKDLEAEGFDVAYEQDREQIGWHPRIDLSNLSQLLALANYNDVDIQNDILDRHSNEPERSVRAVSYPLFIFSDWKLKSEPRANERAIRDVLEMIYTTKQGEDNE